MLVIESIVRGVGCASSEGVSSKEERYRYRTVTEGAPRTTSPALPQEAVADPLVICKFFTPDAQWTWYALEFDGDDVFFGLVVGLEPELGYFLLSELTRARGPLGLPIERDVHFSPTRLSEVKMFHQRGS